MNKEAFLMAITIKRARISRLGFSFVALLILIARKNSMEGYLVFVKAHPDSDEAVIKQKAISRWIWSVVLWGIVSMILIVWFLMYL